MTGMEQIIAEYGSLEVYNEEQRRCGLAQIEVQAQTRSKHVKVECANVVEQTEAGVESKSTTRFSRIASWIVDALSASQPYPYTDFTITPQI